MYDRHYPFSNHLSYRGEIIPLRDDPRFQDEVIEQHVYGKREGQTNRAEAEFIVSTILAINEFREYQGATIGVVSMVSDKQAILVEKLLQKHLSEQEFHSRQILCGNASQFQGDERDVIFLSLVDSPADGPQRLSRTVTMQQRFNVAASRAKNQLWVVHSLDPAVDLQVGDLRKRLIDHARDPSILSREVDEVISSTESPFESMVAEKLINLGYKVIPQWKVGVFRIDLVVRDGAKKLAVECDGEKYHNSDNLIEDMQRQNDTRKAWLEVSSDKRL